MTRRYILETAAELIDGERARTYGDAGESFARTGRLWAEVLGCEVSAEQVALCLSLLKIARLSQTTSHLDSWIDLAGYAALGGEIAAR